MILNTEYLSKECPTSLLIALGCPPKPPNGQDTWLLARTPIGYKDFRMPIQSPIGCPPNGHDTWLLARPPIGYKDFWMPIQSPIGYNTWQPTQLHLGHVTIGIPVVLVS